MAINTQSALAIKITAGQVMTPVIVLFCHVSQTSTLWLSCAKNTTLADDVLAAFERACRKDDLQVAQHLIEALETIAQRENTEENLQRVYAQAARSLHIKPRH
jgi:hypothetical protein